MKYTKISGVLFILSLFSLTVSAADFSISLSKSCGTCCVEQKRMSLTVDITAQNNIVGVTKVSFIVGGTTYATTTGNNRPLTTGQKETYTLSDIIIPSPTSGTHKRDIQIKLEYDKKFLIVYPTSQTETFEMNDIYTQSEHQCDTSNDCAPTKKCVISGCSSNCQEIGQPTRCGSIIDHEWVPQCTSDAQCIDDKYCSNSCCETVLAQGTCGYISNHKWNPYDCCIDPDCPAGKKCSAHKCVEKPIEVSLTLSPTTLSLYRGQSTDVTGTIGNTGEIDTSCSYVGADNPPVSLGDLKIGSSKTFTEKITAPTTGEGTYSYTITVTCKDTSGREVTKSSSVSVTYKSHPAMDKINSAKGKVNEAENWVERAEAKITEATELLSNISMGDKKWEDGTEIGMTAIDARASVDSAKSTVKDAKKYLDDANTNFDSKDYDLAEQNAQTADSRASTAYQSAFTAYNSLYTILEKAKVASNEMIVASNEVGKVNDVYNNLYNVLKLPKSTLT